MIARAWTQSSRLVTTPFRAAFRGDDLAAQVAARRQQSHIEAGNAGGSYDKWQLLRALTEARRSFGVSDRTITVLEALLSFHQSKELDGAAPIIVFPSNAELSLRTRGMAAATLRRHLATLVAARLIARRDSPNGKRFAQRNENGQVAQAFGFDLAPFALLAGTIHEAAEQARAEALALRRMRATITVHLRDISAIVDAGLSEREQDAAIWSRLADDLGALSGRLARNATLVDLEPRRAALARLHAEVEAAWLDGLWFDDLDAADDVDEFAPETKQMSANDADFERHIQNSKTDHTLIKGREDKRKQNGEPEAEEADGEGRSLTVPLLAEVLTRCPAIGDYGDAAAGITSWHDLAAAAEIVRTMLGVSRSAYADASTVMGHRAACTVIAAMLERADTIRAPGGYLRTLTERTRNGQFTLAPMLKALG